MSTNLSTKCPPTRSYSEQGIGDYVDDELNDNSVDLTVRRKGDIRVLRACSVGKSGVKIAEWRCLRKTASSASTRCRRVEHGHGDCRPAARWIDVAGSTVHALWRDAWTDWRHRQRLCGPTSQPINNPILSAFPQANPLPPRS